MRPVKRVIVLCVILLSACASISQTFIAPVNSDFEKNPIYVGVRFDSGIIKAGYFSLTEPPRCAGTDGKLACYAFLPAIIDWPLSLAFDTVFLPYTIPAYYINNSRQDSQNTSVSGSATAIRHADGTITTREPTPSEMHDIEVSRNSLKEIDRKYPGPEIPKNAKLFRVTSVDDKGTITLENGRRIRLEGMKCSPETPDYLRRLLTGDMDRVVYILSATSSDSPAGAYIWHASLSLMNDPEMKKFITGPSYFPLNEGALTSGWCTPERSSSNAYNDRYEELSKIAPNR